MGRILKRYFPQHLTTEVKNCPACGKDDCLWFPIDSAMTSGVGCRRCRLRVTRPFPKLYPRSCPDNLKGLDAIDWMYLYAFFIALKTWNRLPRK